MVKTTMLPSETEMETEMDRIYKLLGKKYFDDCSGIPVNHLSVAHLYLESDFASALKKADDIEQVKSEIIELISCSPLAQEIVKRVSVDKAYKDAMIRRDFKTALRKADSGSSLSAPLGYMFSQSDIIELANTHKSCPSPRQKIEDLLEYCNFHSECGALSRGDYSLIFPDAT